MLLSGDDLSFYYNLLLQWLKQPGFPALFTVSFLASTVVPVGSEWLLAIMLLNGYNPAAAVFTASAGNTLGACTNWLIGRYSNTWLFERLCRITNHQRQRAEAWYNKYGLLSLLFSWLPVVGDPLCLVGGLLNVRFTSFLLLVVSGKFLRYAVTAWLTLKIAGISS